MNELESLLSHRTKRLKQLETDNKVSHLLPSFLLLICTNLFMKYVKFNLIFVEN